MAKKRFAIGDAVRLTGEFLRNTGQMVGGEGQRRWFIVEHQNCRMCASGDFVAVNEPSTDDPERPRHINAHNLEKVRSIPSMLRTGEIQKALNR